MTSRRPEWIHVQRQIPNWWNSGLTDEDFGLAIHPQMKGPHPASLGMPSVQADYQEDLDMGFVPKEALYRALVGTDLNGNLIDRDEDQAILKHYMANRNAVERDFSGLPSIAPKATKDYYRNYIDGLLVAMDNQFRDSFFGRTSVTGGRTWIGADELARLNQQAQKQTKSTLNERDLAAYVEGFGRGVRDYQKKIARLYTRRAVPGWQSPRQPDALAPMEIPLHMLYEELLPEDQR